MRSPGKGIWRSAATNPKLALVGLTRTQAEQAVRDGVAALQMGEAQAAQRAFRGAIDAGFGSAQLWLMLAEAARLAGDLEGQEEALERLLALDPHNLRGLLMRGDCHAGRGAVRAATSFYGAAVAAAAKAGPLPQWLNEEVERAKASLAGAAERYQRSLLDRLAAEREAAGPRFAEALDILLGRKRTYVQQPSAFYFPGLPQRQFYEPEEFGWAGELEASIPAIRAELEAVIAEGADFRPYVEDDPDRPHRDFHGMHGDPSWGAFYLWKDGAVVQENAARCPAAMAALADLPLSRIGARTPSVLFSLLRPGAHIPPHHGMLNCRLICHLPLIVPPGCWLRVGNETRQWEQSRLLVFDDSIEHEAKNDSDLTRIVLLFDIWRPELTAAEREAICAMFDAIDSFRP